MIRIHRKPKMIAPGIAVIGKLVPKELEYYSLATEARKIVERTKTEMFVGSAMTVRPPEQNKELTTHEIASKWHRDSCGKMDVDHMSLLIWSNREQTQFLTPDGQIVDPKPGDVILAVNKIVEHRTPSHVSDDRWFVRVMVKTPSWMEIAQ